MDPEEERALRKSAEVLRLHALLHPENNQGRLSAKEEIERLLYSTSDDVLDPGAKGE
jgi:hypothetical protein